MGSYATTARAVAQTVDKKIKKIKIWQRRAVVLFSNVWITAKTLWQLDRTKW